MLLKSLPVFNFYLLNRKRRIAVDFR